MIGFEVENDLKSFVFCFFFLINLLPQRKKDGRRGMRNLFVKIEIVFTEYTQRLVNVTHL